MGREVERVVGRRKPRGRRAPERDDPFEAPALDVDGPERRRPEEIEVVASDGLRTRESRGQLRAPPGDTRVSAVSPRRPPLSPRGDCGYASVAGSSRLHRATPVPAEPRAARDTRVSAV